MNKRTLRRRLLPVIAAVLAVLMLLGCGADGKTRADSGALSGVETPASSGRERPRRDVETPMGAKDTWTVFIYLCGSDLESDGGMASINLRQIMGVVPKENVNIIVQTGGAQQWGMVSYELDEDTELVLNMSDSAEETRKVSPDKLQRWKVTDHMELLDEVPLASMGAEDTLYDFLKWGVENYPAEKMGVLFWNHGGSALAGVCFDELFEKDSLLPFELDEALERLWPDMTDRFEFIGFDACLMSMVEVAYAVSPYARYMYASEEIVPGFGLYYPRFIESLNLYPGQTGAELGEVICDGYQSFYDVMGDVTGNDSMAGKFTYAVLDLEKIDTVVAALDKLGDRLNDALDRPAEMKQVTLAAMQAEYYSNSYIVDMGSFAQRLEGLYPEEAAAVENSLKEMVLYSVNGTDCSEATGLSVYYPKTGAVTDANAVGSYIVRYALCAPSESYYQFVRELEFKQYRAQLSGVSAVRVLEKPHLEDIDEEYADYCMTIDPESVPQVAEMSYQLWMLAEGLDDDGEPITVGLLLGNDLDVEFDEATGRVTDNFDSTWMSLGGVPLEMNIRSYSRDEVVYISPILLNENRTNLLVRWTEKDGYTILGTYTGCDEETGVPSREVFPLKNGDTIVPRYEKAESYIIDAGAKEYASREDYVPGEALTYRAGMQVERRALYDGIYIYQYCMTDIYGTKRAFSPLYLEIEDGEAYVLEEDELYEEAA